MRPALPLLLAAFLAGAILALPPGGAGTQAQPEITDPSGDFLLVQACNVQTNQLPTCSPPVNMPSQVSRAADIIKAWVTEDPSNFYFNVQTAGPVQAGATPAQPQSAPYYTIQIDFRFTANGTARTATAVASATGLAASGVATAVAANTAGDVLNLTVPRSPASTKGVHAGDLLTKLSVLGKGVPPVGSGGTAGSDFAPDTGFGLDYVVQKEYAPPNLCTYKVGETNKTDADRDCLPDFWETTYFGGSAAQNATGDPDGDGCNNRCEYLAGTDPTKAYEGCTFRADETNKTDVDRDCLPDAWEKRYFTNVTAQNGTGDPDGDTCDNRCEYLAGTDPTVAQVPCVFKQGETNKTDGDADCLPDYWERKYFNGTAAQNATGDPDKDGCDNRCEYLAGTDPNKSNIPIVTTTTPPAPKTSTSTTGGPGIALGKQSAREKLQADAGYVVASAAAMAAVVLVSLAGRFGRWGG